MSVTSVGYGDGDMQRWKETATAAELRLALKGRIERILRECREAKDICGRLGNPEGGLYCTQMLQSCLWLEHVVQKLEIAEAKSNEVGSTT